MVDIGDKTSSMVKGSQQNRPRHRASLVFLLACGMLIVVELIDEISVIKAQPTEANLLPAWLRAWDLVGFTLINERLSWNVLDPIMLVVTRIGSTVFWLLVSVLLWTGNKRREAVLLTVGIVVGELVLLPVKFFLPRARPSLVVQGARALDIESGASFPSGHSKNGFTVFVILGSKWRRLRLPLFAIACLIAMSRIYIGVHWPFDVIAGSLVGWIIGQFTIRYETKIINTFNSIPGVAI